MNIESFFFVRIRGIDIIKRSTVSICLQYVRSSMKKLVFIIGVMCSISGAAQAMEQYVASKNWGGVMVLLQAESKKIFEQRSALLLQSETSLNEANSEGRYLLHYLFSALIWPGAQDTSSTLVLLYDLIAKNKLDLLIKNKTDSYLVNVLDDIHDQAQPDAAIKSPYLTMLNLVLRTLDRRSLIRAGDALQEQ